MKLKYKCKWCGTKTMFKGQSSFNCREKEKIIKDSGIFGGKAKKQRYKTRWERTDTVEAYTHEMGSETQKLVDYVNKSGTVHYGRYVAKERWRNGNNKNIHKH